MAEYRSPQRFDQGESGKVGRADHFRDPILLLLEQGRSDTFYPRNQISGVREGSKFAEQQCGSSSWPCAEITADMVRIGNSVSIAFDRRIATKDTQVPSGIVTEGLYLTRSTSEPPMFDQSIFASMTRREPNLESLLMQRLSNQPGPITQQKLSEVALELCTGADQLTDKKMALVLLHNFTKNLTAAIRNPNTLSQQDTNKYPADTYRNELIKPIADRLEHLGKSRNQSDALGQIYHFYGATLATFTFERGAWVGLQKYWRLVSSTDPRNVVKNGADRLGYQLGRQLQESDVLDQLLRPQ